ncbi:TetR/AcrR family transcriptional regulator [Edaphobacillus lindanitolerans]|uniref:Transcriptional regulator, TetR family n=1 Tax=Edaphobacillus lindanitolerans TaxID=550447 RepID=A0A1U7PL18_9BACI|nr:TetR/AcrR family transcriptional regulator [Edaphobacillus lindanitolerans]SIT72668.1 transcriptional regulator, TetR family [Edaphobacillus lindanitolerans]
MVNGNRQSQAEQTKQRLFETALELFKEKGFDQVSVDEIVQKSNSSKGAFYGHFKSKYGIFIEKFKEIDHFYEEYVGQIPEDRSFKEKVLLLFEGQMNYLEHVLGKDLMRTVYISGLNETDENFFSNSERSLYRIVRGLIGEAIERGELRRDADPRQLTWLITRCMRGTLYDWHAFGDTFDLQKESKEFIELFLDGLMGRYGVAGQRGK